VQRGSSAAPIRSCQVEQIQRLGKALIWYAARAGQIPFALSTQQQHNTHMHKNNLRGVHPRPPPPPLCIPLCTRAMGVSFVLSFFSPPTRDAPSRARSNKTRERDALGEAQKRADDEKRREEISSREKRGRAKYGESLLPTRAQGDQSNYRQSLY